MEESKDLLRPDTRDIIDETTASDICQAEEQFCKGQITGAINSSL